MTPGRDKEFSQATARVERRVNAKVSDTVFSRFGRQYQSLIGAVLVTSIFSLRWINSLPFSGYMPVIKDGDNLTMFGSYLIYAKEPFGFPIGVIRGLGFPLDVSNISRASIPLFAIPLKLLSTLYAPLSEYYYFVLVELLSVFFTAYFAGLLLMYFRVNSFPLRLLGAVLCSLSFVLLYRSSYYNYSIHVAHFPIYLAGAYLYLQLATRPNLRRSVLFALLFPIAALTDASYLLFGISFLAFVCLLFNFIEFILNKNEPGRKRLMFVSSSFLIGMLLTVSTMYVVGTYYTIMEVDPGVSPLRGRYAEGWGYGGGYGGGFHVADVFTLLVPPGKGRWDGVSGGLPAGNSYLTELGVPITTDSLQPGQYEGFAYLGTTVLAIIGGLLIARLVRLMRAWRTCSGKVELRRRARLSVREVVVSLPVALGTSSLMLYVMSWGYIFHVFGHKIYEVPTPSLILAIVWPQFMLLRAPGRWAFAFALFIIIATVVWLDRSLDQYPIHGLVKGKKILFNACIIILVLIHVYEIRGYLRPSQVVYGNDIAKMFNEEDIRLIKAAAQDKTAMMIVPYLRSSFEWKKIGNSLAFHSGIPINGTNVGLGVNRDDMNVLQSDINTILVGNVREIINKYGDVAIAAPPDTAAEILNKADVPLKSHRLESQRVTILTRDD